MLRRRHPGSFVVERDTVGQLRTNVEQALQDLERPSIMITSPTARGPSASTAVALARALAKGRLRVVLVDSDVRRPLVHKLIGIDNELGLTDVVLADKRVESCIRFVKVAAGSEGRAPGFYALAAGQAGPDADDVVGHSRMRQVVASLERAADVVLISAPPVVDHSDSLVLGRYVGGALLVVERRRCSISVVEQARNRLQANQVRLIGAVLQRPTRGRRRRAAEP